MKLGKKIKRFDHRTLQLARYLAPKLPEPPVSIDHASLLPAAIGMMGNDKYGDCVVAGAGHAIQEWSTYAEKEMLVIPDNTITQTYLKLSPNDQGLVILDWLNYWRKSGLGGEKIEAFVEIAAGDITQTKLAIQIFGSAFIGLALPDTNTFGPWDVTNPTWKPNPNNGHLIIAIAYDDAKQQFTVVTWGEKVPMSYGWLQKYNDESYAIADDLSLRAAGTTPEGFNWQQLQDDLGHIGDPVTPPEPTPTPPTPTPPTPVSGQYQPVFTAKSNPNYIVSLDGQNQTPTHISSFEAAEHAAGLKLANPDSVVLISTNGVEEVTLKKI